MKDTSWRYGRETLSAILSLCSVWTYSKRRLVARNRPRVGGLLLTPPQEIALPRRQQLTGKVSEANLYQSHDSISRTEVRRLFFDIEGTFPRDRKIIS